MLRLILIILIAVPVIGAGYFYYLGQQSQQSTPPGLIDGKLAPCPSSPNCLSSEDGTPESHKTDPLPKEFWPSIVSSLEESDRGFEIVAVEETYIAATEKSDLFGFVDDLEFRLDDEVVHIRSASRVGYGDQGVNAARVEAVGAMVE